MAGVPRLVAAERVLSLGIAHQEHVNVANEDVGRAVGVGGVELDPLGDDERVHVAEHGQQKDELRHELTPHVHRVAQMTAT